MTRYSMEDIDFDHRPHRAGADTESYPTVDIDQHLAQAPVSDEWLQNASTWELLQHALGQTTWRDWCFCSLLFLVLLVGYAFLT